MAWKKLFSFDDHSIWYTREQTPEISGGDGGDNGDGAETLSDASSALAGMWKSISEQLQVDLETFSKDRGDMARSLIQNLTAVNRERYDYTSF